MTILHIETLKRWGGEQNRVLSEVIGLAQRGHKVLIACNPGSVLARKAKDSGIKVYELLMNKKNYLLTIPRLLRIIRDEDVKIVSTHSTVDSWAGGIAAKLAGRKFVRFRHNLYRIGRDPLSRFIYALPDRLVAVGEPIRQYLADTGISEHKLLAIFGTVDAGKFSPGSANIRAELGISSDSMVIGNTSTFSSAKGQEFLFKAFNIICRQSPCFLLMAGSISGPLRKTLLSYVDEDLHEKIIFPGHREDIPQVLATYDIFVFPSVTEGLPTALCEAMSMEKAVAVSDIFPNQQLVIDGENGIFFRVCDPEDIAAKVLVLLRDDLTRRRLAQEARNTILQRFTIDKMIDDMEALYEELLNVCPAK